MESVIINLLSNAFKFTFNDGDISIALKFEISSDREDLGNRAIITVKDTGIGIKEKDIPYIFNRFYQADSSSTKKFEGTGIGLTLVKEIVEKHKGTIVVKSTEGVGTSFIIDLPTECQGEKHLTEAKINNAVKYEIENISPKLQTTFSSEINNKTNLNNKEIVLIVEDNDDMAWYIASVLSDEYQLQYAKNGKEGIRIANAIMPDAIISDLMMPEMDGFTFAKAIRNNIVTSHIPIIILTAKADRETKLEGLNNEIDDFLLKPFDKQELRIRVKNLITQRNLLKESFQKKITIVPGKVKTSESLDDTLIRKIGTLIEENYSNSAYKVETLCTDVGMSYRNFHRKIKALTGESPSQIILSYRLDKSAQLIIQKEFGIAEIAYKTGFENPSYFTKCFKIKYGCTPSQYTTNLNTKPSPKAQYS